MPWSFSEGAVAEKYMPQLQPQFVARPGRSGFFFCCLLRGRDPSPPPFFFIDEFDAHGLKSSVGALIHGFSVCIPIEVETHPLMGLALFSMRYRIIIISGFAAVSTRCL
jgi:hypothetical protein